MKKHIIYLLILLSIIYFAIFLIPNNSGAETIEMLSVFEPDEFAQYPHVIRMVEFEGISLRHQIWHFVAYQHYYYGFPFYAFSALWLFPVKFLSNLANVQLNVLLLRQLVSVLPMLLSIWILVYLQTRFNSFLKTLVLFGFLLSIPIVIKNNLWWHPDSLAILFSVLVIFFLVKDNFNFGKYFYYGAAMVGLSIGTKMLGWFFFLTIPTYLCWGYFDKRISWLTLIKKAAGFLFIMVLTVLISNPALIHPEERTRYFEIQKAQSQAMGFGWDVAYKKGPFSWYDIVIEYYGHWTFLLLVTISLGIGIYKKETRLLNVIVLTWFLPMLVYILFFVAIKPTHLLMPIALPFFSSFVNVLPSWKDVKGRYTKTTMIVGIIILLFQFGRNVLWDYDQISRKTNREETHPAIVFYSKLEDRLFNCLPGDKQIKVFRDIRAYVPSTPDREIFMSWETIDYEYIENLNPEVIVLQQQKISDYTSPNIVSTAKDKSQMINTLEFYTDAKAKKIVNYQPIIEDEYGLAFVRNDLLSMIDCESE